MTEYPSTDLFPQLRAGDRNALARSITLIESHNKGHQELAEGLLENCLPHSGNSIRIGITGVPGVGKSTFIETFGNYLISAHGKRVAVLAIDPTSTKSKGSILGDKTRMSSLALNEAAFIRPSPSSGSLGGVGLATREIIVLCEAAGYDVIIVETVGVGQSETEVREMVDFFMLLLLPGAGDELQGIKRGIVELADVIFINKADGDNLKKAGEAKAAYTSALGLFPADEKGWKIRVELCSALKAENLDLAWDLVTKFDSLTEKNGWKSKNRETQIRNWFRRATEGRILAAFEQQKGFEQDYARFEEEVRKKEISPRRASRMLIESVGG